MTGSYTKEDIGLFAMMVRNRLQYSCQIAGCLYIAADADHSTNYTVSRARYPRSEERF